MAIALPLATAAFAAPPALAADPHVFSFEITGSGAAELSRPSAVAVDNSSGPSAHDVYVGDPANFRVVKFDQAGNFILMFGDGVDESTGGDVCSAASGDTCKAGSQADEAGQPPGGFRVPAFIAVDSSSGPSAGDLYVGDESTAVVSKFDSSGELITSWGVGGQIAVDAIGVSGVAVGPDGKLIVVGFNFGPDSPLHSKLFEYDQGGEEGPPVVTSASYPFGLAVDSAGDRYKVGEGNSIVQKVDATGAQVGELEVAGYVAGFAIDPDDDHAYVRHGGVISRVPSSCPEPPCDPIETFGGGYLSNFYEYRAVAVDASAHVVYTADSRTFGDGFVAVFVPPGIVPEVVTGSSVHLDQKTVVVDGQVDPDGNGIVTGCEFEYVDRLSSLSSGWAYAKTVPCSPVPPYSAPAHVTATLTGFAPGMQYQYRLVATNAGGRRTGLARGFEVRSLSEAATGSVTELSDSAATVHGTVKSHNGAEIVGCIFEYVDDAHFQTGGYSPALQERCSPAPPLKEQSTQVTARLSRLAAQTTYHYRLFAWDSYGESTGVDRVFTTPPALVIPVDPETEVPETELPQGGPLKVRCSKRACVRTLIGAHRPQTWVSPRFPTSYGWLFSVYVAGESLPHSKPADGCVSTFRGHGVVATLNGCRGRFRLTYSGTGEFKVRWRVFEYCRCAEYAGDRGRRRTPQPAQPASTSSRRS